MILLKIYKNFKKKRHIKKKLFKNNCENEKDFPPQAESLYLIYNAQNVVLNLLIVEERNHFNNIAQTQNHSLMGYIAHMAKPLSYIVIANI